MKYPGTIIEQPSATSHSASIPQVIPADIPPYQPVYSPTSKWRYLEIAFLVGLGCLMEIGSAATSWFHFFTFNEPTFVKVLRLALGLCALSVVVTFFSKRYRATAAFWAGIAGLILPMLAVFVMTVHDAHVVGEAVHENTVARMLLHELNSSDINPYVPWTEQRQMVSEQLLTNEYTFTDGFEALSYNAKVGWFLSFAGGTFLLFGGSLWSRKEVCQSMRKGSAISVCLLLIITVYVLTPLVIAHYYWNRGRAEVVSSDYTGALRDYKKAVALDPRFDYDVQFHYELGRLYAILGMTRQQDYWAAEADAYLFIGWTDRAYNIYTEHVTDPTENPALAMRYENALVFIATTKYNAGNREYALQIFKKALAADPDNLQVLYDIGMIDADNGDYQDSCVIWHKIINFNESVGYYKNAYFVASNYRKMITARAWTNLSWCYYNLHEYDLAAQCAANSVTIKKASSALFADEGGSS